MSERNETLKEDTTQEPTRGQAGVLSCQQVLARWLEVLMALMLAVVAVAIAERFTWGRSSDPGGGSGLLLLGLFHLATYPIL
jgi:hypothetical protein